MKIAMLCRYFAPHIGGVEKHVLGVSQEASKEGHVVDVFALKHENTLLNIEVKDGVRIHRCKELMGGKISERLTIWSWLLWNIPTFIAADIIQIHDVFYWYWPIRILLPWKKVYITYHGFEAGSLPTEKAKRTRQMIQRWTRGSMAVGSWIEKWYGTKPDTITYGAAECISHTSTQSKMPKQSNLFDAVFLGRLAEDTGLNIYAETLSEFKHFQLDIFGAGSLKKWARALASKKRNITVLGTADDSCVVFPLYDIACVSSYLSIVEAMQSKVLVVAYAADELKWDYLQAHPRARDMIIVRTREELSEFLRTYSNDRYAKQVENAYQWASQQTWNRVYGKYQKLWSEK